MTHYRLRREGNVDVAFDGEIIVDVNSKDEPDQERWNEIRIYSTTKGNYVVENTGKSVIIGEGDRTKVYVCANHEQIVKALQRGPNKFGEYYLTNVALMALDAFEEKMGITLVEEA